MARMYVKTLNGPAAIKLCGIIFTAVGLIFAIIGVSLGVSNFNKKSRCTAETSAIVINIKSQISTRRSNHHTRHTRVYAPVFQYKVDGTEYTTDPHSYSSNCNEQIGDVVTLNYNPNNPSEYYYNGDSSIKIIFIVFTSIGTVFTIVGIIMFCSFLKTKKSGF